MHWPACNRARVALALGALLACGLAVSASAAMTAATSRRNGSRISANARYAQRTVRRLLAEVPLPAGAQPASSDESSLGVLGGPETSPQKTAQLVQAHAFWRLPGSPEEAIASIESHPPPGSQVTVKGSSGKTVPPPPPSLRGPQLAEYVKDHTVATSWDTVFSFSAPRTKLSTVWLSVIVAAAKGGGTALRADALVVWVKPRPATERVPAGVRAIRVQVSDPRHHLSYTRTITSPRRVRSVIALIEGLQRPEPGTSSCPADTGREPVIDLAFLARDGRTLVRVRIDDNGCGVVRFWAGEREQPVLAGAYEATKALRRLLHLAV